MAEKHTHHYLSRSNQSQHHFHHQSWIQVLQLTRKFWNSPSTYSSTWICKNDQFLFWHCTGYRYSIAIGFNHFSIKVENISLVLSGAVWFQEELKCGESYLNDNDRAFHFLVNVDFLGCLLDEINVKKEMIGEL